MTIQSVQNQLALLARQVAKAANKNPHLNDAADVLFVACLKLDVPGDQLPQ
jgi:hypothetical protein